MNLELGLKPSVMALTTILDGYAMSHRIFTVAVVLSRRLTAFPLGYYLWRLHPSTSPTRIGTFRTKA